MNKRKDLIKQDDARVSLIDLAINEETPWHFHTEIVENVVCLNGRFELQCKPPNVNVCLMPGERYEIIAMQQTA